MSSNIANLRKARKNPFQPSFNHGHRSIPFRNGSLSVDESELLEDVAGNMTKNRKNSDHHTISPGSSLPKVKDASPRIANLNTTPSASPNDHEMLTAMMNRLAQLEQKLQSQTKEIIEKDKKIRILHEKVSILNRAREDDGPTQVQELQKKCLLLQQQVHEMETFLKDYGMEWLGDKMDTVSDKYLEEDEYHKIVDTRSQEQMWKPGLSLASFEVNFDLVIKNIEDLNILAGEGVAKIQHTTDGARLRLQDAVQLTLYANGIIMFSGPFRSYEDLSTQQCIKDIQDGYFPTELQNRYPEGVPIKVTDKREVLFVDNRHDIFKGTGQMLGGDSKPSCLLPTKLDKIKEVKKPSGTNFKKESELPGSKVSLDRFLNKLPSSIVKGGKVIEIRHSIADRFKGKESERTALQISEEIITDKQQSASTQITTLRVKSENGDHTFVCKMLFSDTIGDLRNQLDRHRASMDDYEIMSAFPSRVFSDNSITLQEGGLVPNAALHLKSKKST